MAAATCIIANGGMQVRPHVVDTMVFKGKVVHPTTGPVRRAISTGAASQVADMMVSVVEEGSPAARVPGYTVAGKTGTAQIAIEGGYSLTETIHSFVGLPVKTSVRRAGQAGCAEDPPLGGYTAAPTFAGWQRLLRIWTSAATSGAAIISRRFRPMKLRLIDVVSALASPDPSRTSWQEPSYRSRARPRLHSVVNREIDSRKVQPGSHSLPFPASTPMAIVCRPRHQPWRSGRSRRSAPGGPWRFLISAGRAQVEPPVGLPVCLLVENTLQRSRNWQPIGADSLRSGGGHHRRRGQDHTKEITAAVPRFATLKARAI
jgi:hypothetical protein